MVTRRTVLTAAGAMFATTAGARADGMPLYELRSYAMQPGRRDELVTMFESVFLDAYERGGTRVLGTFTTPDDADRWIWLRAFPDAATRGAALANFYGSDDWRTRAAAANATIVDTSDVLLLRAVAGAPDAGELRADSTSSMIECRVHLVPARGERAFARRWLALAAPRLRALDAAPFAVLVTDRRPNAYPRQSVRDDSVVVTFTRFASLEAHASALERCAHDAAWREIVEPAFASARRAPPELRRLLPTARSRLR